MTKNLWGGRIRALASFALFVLFFGSTANATDIETTLIVLGDSISAGTLADTHIRPQTKGMIADFLFENKETLSWASGSEIASHYTRLSQKFGKDHVQVVNYAKPGALSRDLPEQIEKVRRFFKENKNIGLPYITLMIGGNDLCAEEPESDPNAAQDIFNALKSLAQLSSERKMRVLMSGLPRVPDLGSPDMLKSRTILVSCETWRWMHPMCPRLLNWKSDAEYSAALDVVQKKNMSMQEVAEKASALFPNLDIRYSNEVFNSPLTPDLIAADCFHPNQKGQEMIAEILWKDQVWY